MGGAKKYRVLLRLKDRRQLDALVRKGVHKARVINRARILLMADERGRERSNSDAEICQRLGISLRMVAATRQKYWRFGLRQALGEKPRSGHPPKLSGKGEALLTTIACTDAPQGRSRWTLRLLADKLVELAEVDSISKETVRRVLKRPQALAKEAVVPRADNGRVLGAHGGHPGTLRMGLRSTVSCRLLR